MVQGDTGIFIGGAHAIYQRNSYLIQNIFILKKKKAGTKPGSACMISTGRQRGTRGWSSGGGVRGCSWRKLAGGN